MLLSVVIPCLNECDTIAECVRVARQTMEAHGIDGEVVVADNGSTDQSHQVAGAAGARVVRIAAKGYGNALDGGVRASAGNYVIMGDADGSYDFAAIPFFLEKLEAGSELVVGCRLPAGGGTMEPGAMPFLHRWVGNPMFSGIARWWFGVPVHDINCGLRAFSREAYLRLSPLEEGMSFAAEMILTANLQGMKISEVPIAFRRDKRRNMRPHLRTFRDGWRILRMFVKRARQKRSTACARSGEAPAPSLPR